jgi:hypothetical protein
MGILSTLWEQTIVVILVLDLLQFVSLRAIGIASASA